MRYDDDAISRLRAPAVWVALLVILSLVGFAPGVLVSAEEPESETVSFDFVEGDIRTLIQTVSELTGRNFVIDPQVTGEITVVSPTEVPRDSVFQVFESILNTYGFTIVPSGEVFRIVPSRSAKSVGEVGVGRRIAPGTSSNQVVTQLIPLRNISSQELMNSLRPLLSPDVGMVMAHDESNTLIVTDSAENVRRIVRIAENLDTGETGETLFSIRLENASAQRVASILQELFSLNDPSARAQARNPQQTTKAENFQVVADERTNLLLILAPPHLRGRIEETVARLDEEVDLTQSSIHVYFLRNADAVELAKILSDEKFWQQEQQDPNQPTRFRGRQPAPTNDFIDDVAITADASTNSLIIKADSQRYKEIVRVVEQLDGPRRQVLVEALIAEVTENVSRDIGVEWRVLDSFDAGGGEQAIAIGGTTLPTGVEGSALQRVVTNPADSPTGLIIGAASGTITFNGAEILSLSALARAFEGDNRINVVSNPYLLTTDHEEAEIVVGEERPFLKASQVTSNDSTINSFEYKDVGLTLRMTPHISQGRRVRLELFQEITDFLEQSDLGAITTTKRTAETTVVVDDKQTVVIGGLLRDSRTNLENRVPCLGKVPVLGWIFKAARRSRAKTNLLIFLTPHVLLTPEELQEVTRDKQGQLPPEDTERTLMDLGADDLGERPQIPGQEEQGE